MSKGTKIILTVVLSVYHIPLINNIVRSHIFTSYQLIPCWNPSFTHVL